MSLCIPGCPDILTMRGKTNSPRPTPFAQWLTDTRVGRKLTMTALGARVDLSHSRISQLESGDEPTPDVIRRLSRALAPESAGEDVAQRLYDEAMHLAFPTSDKIRREPLNSIIREKGYNPDVLDENETAMLDSGIEGLIDGIMRRKGQEPDSSR